MPSFSSKGSTLFSQKMSVFLQDKQRNKAEVQNQKRVHSNFLNSIFQLKNRDEDQHLSCNRKLVPLQEMSGESFFYSDTANNVLDSKRKIFSGTTNCNTQKGRVSFGNRRSGSCNVSPTRTIKTIGELSIERNRLATAASVRVSKSIDKTDIPKSLNFASKKGIRSTFDFIKHKIITQKQVLAQREEKRHESLAGIVIQRDFQARLPYSSQTSSNLKSQESSLRSSRRRSLCSAEDFFLCKSPTQTPSKQARQKILYVNSEKDFETLSMADINLLNKQKGFNRVVTEVHSLQSQRRYQQFEDEEEVSMIQKEKRLILIRDQMLKQQTQLMNIHKQTHNLHKAEDSQLPEPTEQPKKLRKKAGQKPLLEKLFGEGVRFIRRQELSVIYDKSAIPQRGNDDQL